MLKCLDFLQNKIFSDFVILSIISKDLQQKNEMENQITYTNLAMQLSMRGQIGILVKNKLV